MTRVYLAWSSAGERTLRLHAETSVDMLLSYHYRSDHAKTVADRGAYSVDHLALDSGAYSAWSSGAQIDNEDFISWALEQQADDVFALDVIGDWKASIVNAKRAWDRGLPAIPCFHASDPPRHLTWCIENTPCHKIAISGWKGAGRFARQVEWVREVYKHIWPHRLRVHAFAMTRADIVEAVPLHSVDSTSWVLGPDRFGLWSSAPGVTDGRKAVYYGQRGYNRSTLYDFWSEVEVMRARSARAAHLWRRELREIEEAAQAAGAA